jgi:alpha-mannosidase
VHNGLVAVQVDRLTGTFAIDGHAGMGRLVDDGDRGDTYNWCPPADHRAVDRPSAVEIDVVERGPVRGRVVVTRTYPLPERIIDEERVGRVDTTVTTTLEVRLGEPFVRVGIELDNQSRDHRLRMWFPLPEATTTSVAECAFATVERGLVAEGGPTERPLPTFPSRRFVQAGGVTVAHEGLLEYELVDIDIDDGGAHALALTLLRCTGMLSQGPMTTRPLPAGPEDPLEGPQMQGAFRAELVLAVGDVDPYALADDAFTPLLVALPRRGGEPRTDHDQALDITGAEVSAVRRVDGMLEVRVFNPGAEPTRVSTGSRQGWIVDLRGRTLDRFDHHLELAPGRIATLRLEPAAT